MPRLPVTLVRLARPAARAFPTLLRAPRPALLVPSLPPCRCFSNTPSRSTSSTYTIGELDVQQYQGVSDRAMDRLTEYLEELIEEVEADEGYEVEYSAGVLTLKLGDQGTYVVNKQPPNKQIWLSSPISGPKRYDYDTKAKVWFYHRDGTLMRDLLNGELRVLMSREGVDVDLGEEDTNE